MKQAKIVKTKPVKENSIVKFDAEGLIEKAISQNVPVETMEKLLSMRRELKAEWAKEQFDMAMANFQANCPLIAKTKEVRTRNGMVAYRYAPIESIVEQVKDVLQENGFSYSTNMQLMESGVKVQVKVTHNSGHSEVTEMEVPLGNKTDVMSASQVVAAAQTFAKRYAFCNAFGILTGDEDADAVPQQDDNPIPRWQPKEPQTPVKDAEFTPTTQQENFKTAMSMVSRLNKKEDLEKALYKLENNESFSKEQKLALTSMLNSKIKLLK